MKTLDRKSEGHNIGHTNDAFVSPMSHLMTCRPGSALLPLRNASANLSLDASSRPRDKGAVTGAGQTMRVKATAASKIDYTHPSPDNKWFKRPKIPIRLNSSTLIRMKNNQQSAGDRVLGDERATAAANQQLTIAAISFLKRDRRMSDYEVANGMSPFGDASLVKNIFLDLVSNGDATAQTMAAASVNPAGDGPLSGATYHRFSAFSLNDRKSGCNVRFVERVSIESATGSVGRASPVDDTRGGGANDDSVRRLNATLRQTTLDESKKEQNNGGVSGDGDGDGGDEKVVNAKDEGSADDEERDRMTRQCRRTKARRKNRRAVVVTSLKTSSIKYVRKASRSEANG